MSATGVTRAARISPKRLIRVASVPSGHPYIRHLSAPRDDGSVVRLPDIPQAGDGRWWPPAMLDADWIASEHERFDVFHVHFGFDAKSPDELRAICGALRAADVPLVVTAHDLRNPHHPDAALHDAQLAVLLEHAAAVITLTEGAAAAIASRYGRTAAVLPHPHIVDFETMARPRPGHDGFVVGLHAKSLRANMDVTSVAPVLAAAVQDVHGGRLRIDVHHEVFEQAGRREVGEALRALAATGEHVELHEHDYFSDEELWDYLTAIDVSVLPYRFGTHSGWLEACFDLGTAVVAPDCGFYDQQRPCHLFSYEEPGSLAAAVHAAHAQRPAPRAHVGQRRKEREALASAHRALYERVLG